MKGWVQRHPLSSFLLLAYAVSWSIAVPLALQAQDLMPGHLPFWLHYLTAFGPAAAAFVVARLLRVRPGAVTRAPSTWDGRSMLWWTIGFGSPLLLFVAARIAGRIAGQTVPAWTTLGHVNFLPELGVTAWGLWFVTSGLGEELGWRGFALPHLQRTHPALTSTLFLASGWAGWHVPAFFYVPSYMDMGLRVIPGFFLGLLAGAIVLSWLYNSSGGSVVAAALWHASFNFVSASPNAGGIVAAVTSILVMVWAIAVVWGCDWETLSGRPRASRSVRATRDERARGLPGDELIADPIGSLQHGITIRCARQDVWPWIAQMGAGTRAGWYSYDILDNGHRPSAEQISPTLQALSVGMVFPALPGATDGFTLLAFEPERFLVLGWITPHGERLMTWAFILEDAAPGSTRLLVRARGASGYRFHGLPWWAARPIVTMVHFTMQRRQLLGIARRAETRAPEEDPCCPQSSSASRSGRSTGSPSAAGSASGAPPPTISRA
jgi:membrane protease YdiL (CAAX protease family)